MVHDPAVQIRPDQPDDTGIPDALAQAVDQDVMVDPVEELLRVHVHHDPP
jgi:hypothetical protein